MAHDSELAIVVLAGGRGTRFGGDKHLAPVGPAGEPIAAYTLHDAARAGFSRAVIVSPPRAGTSAAAELARWAPRDFGLSAVEQERPTFRKRPWGTGHAVLAARDEVAGTPFAVANADDFYGGEAIAALAGVLRTVQKTADRSLDRIPHAIIAYELDRTMEVTERVSRARCVERDGRLVRVEERFDVRARPRGGYTSRTPEGEADILDPRALVSMNLWGFHPSILVLLEAQWERFVANDPDADAEFMIPDAVNDMLAAGAQVRVCATRSRAFGLTFPEDIPRVRAAIARLVADGHYPPALSGDGEAGRPRDTETACD